MRSKTEMPKHRNSDNSGAARAQRLRWQAAAATTNVRTNIGSMITGGVLWNHGVWPQTTPGGAASSSPTPPPPPVTVPDPPTDVAAVSGNAEATVSFTPSAGDVTLYIVTSSPGGLVATGTSSPITVPYLSNNTSYTFTVVATNSAGDSAASEESSSITTPVPDPTAPTITGINTLTTSLIVSFTAPTSFSPTNYEYSLDGGETFTALSPVDTSSPITIPSLTPTTDYIVAIRAINNVPSTGDSSNIVAVTTASQQITETFTTVGETTWTAPANVRNIQYLCAAGGGGGGGTYSDIIDLGNVPVQSSPPSTGGYWIFNGVTTSVRTYARMYNGANTDTSGGPTTFTVPIRVTASEDTINLTNDKRKWYGNKEFVYYLKAPNYVQLTNFSTGSAPSPIASNKPSGGSGGGAGGQVRMIRSTTTFYSVTPRTSYTVIVGDGGDGGIGGPGSETAGAKGEDSSFDTIVCEGGSGGQPSRVLTFSTNGYNNGGNGGENGADQLIGGRGGEGAGGVAQSQSGTGGSAGGTFDYSSIFVAAVGSGGKGGDSGTVATGTTTPNTGNGGAGTGATLNSYASGIKGGSGVVMLKYYI